MLVERFLCKSDWHLSERFQERLPRGNGVFDVWIGREFDSDDGWVSLCHDVMGERRAMTKMSSVGFKRV
jgi:hypothetical protein